ncbi:ABC transporter permease [Pseudonocardia sp. TRM90224]|uniref:ABC transporter permease n=1 Tax=Pseudonocardia sp. TRM90224 TaxID=2812678 RepID=UPI001E3D3852|nr:ABC transporter permease [Pseudonocardia sp. TRM90224]
MSAYALTDSSVMIGRSLRHTTRNFDSLFIGIFLPVMLLLLMTTVFGGAVSGTAGDYVTYVVPGVLLLCAGYGASMTAMSVTTDMKEGIVDRFRTMNVLPSAVLTGHVVASVARNLVSVGIVIATAYAIGFRAAAGPLGWLAAIGLIVLLIFAMSWASAAFGLVAKTPEGASSFGFFLLFLPYLSSAFVPIDTLPGWLQPIATAQPFTPLNESIRGLLLGNPIGNSGWAAVAWCLGILVVSGFTASALWRRTRR